VEFCFKSQHFFAVQVKKREKDARYHDPDEPEPNPQVFCCVVAGCMTLLFVRDCISFQPGLSFLSAQPPNPQPKPRAKGGIATLFN
jgi:hypothetical protein